ncbi:MAG TPA: hypothetical protein V6D34_00730, partial [Candidatus Sericytochromatia bacterium]
MKRQHPEVLAFLSQSGITLSVLLLSLGATVQPVRSSLTERSLGQAMPLAQLQTDTPSAPSQSSSDRSVARITTLFNVLLGILIVLLAATIAALWLLRRAVIQEIATRATEQLEGLQELESQIAKTRENAKTILEEVETIADDVAEEAELFQQDVAKERDTLSSLIVDLAQSKTKTLADLATQLVTSKQALEDVGITLAEQLTSSQSVIEQQQSTALEQLAASEQEFAAHLAKLQAAAVAQQTLMIGHLEQLKTDVKPHLDAVQSDVQQQKEHTLQA